MVFNPWTQHQHSHENVGKTEDIYIIIYIQTCEKQIFLPKLLAATGFTIRADFKRIIMIFFS